MKKIILMVLILFLVFSSAFAKKDPVKAYHEKGENWLWHFYADNNSVIRIDNLFQTIKSNNVWRLLYLFFIYFI